MWSISEAASRKIKGTHISFPRQIAGKRAHRNTDSDWVTLAAREILRAT